MNTKVINCGHCYFSELIDGVCFCNYWEEDVDYEEEYCKYYIHTDVLNSVLITFVEALFGDLDMHTNLYDFIQDFQEK